MKKDGHALVELVLCLGTAGVLLFGSAFIRHLFRARAAALTLVAAGCDLAGHPDLSDDERSRLLNEASRRLFACPFCRIDIETHRFLDQPSAHFYNLVQTRAVVHFGHDHLRSLLSLPASLEESSVVAREPSHDLL